MKTLLTYLFLCLVLIMNREKPQEFTMPCLGRQFEVGMLYDCRSDQLVSSVALWNEETLKQALDSKPQSFIRFEVIEDNSTTSKLSKLGVDENLKMSFLAGLVDVSGAAAYLNDQTSSENQARVSLRYQSTAWIDRLSIEKLGDLDNPDVFKDTTATHFVSGVLYGADAVFVFDQEVSHNEVVCDSHEFMKTMVKLLPTLCTSGNAALDISGIDKSKAQKFRCKLYCDRELPETPSTFEGAAKLCKGLPQVLGESDSPQKVWLYPLSKLNSKVEPIIRKISAGFVAQTQDFMEATHELEMKTSDLMHSEVCTSFVAIKKQLSCFKRRIAEYKVDFASNLATLIPKVRGGIEEEEELNKVFTEKDTSLFSHARLSSWVEGKMSEVKVLKKYLSHMKDFEFAFLPGDMDSVVSDPEYNLVISFTFTAAGQCDPYLEGMTAYLQPHATGQDVKNLPISWYNDSKIISNMKARTRLFKSFAEANKQVKETKFVVTSSIDELSEEGAVIKLYENCNKEIFEPPSQPGKPSATSVTHNSVQVNWSKPECGAENVQFYTVYYCDLSSSPEQWKAEKTSGSKDSITVTNLRPQKKYCFKVQAGCKAGLSEISEVSEPIQTDLVSVAPGKPIVSSKSHNSIQLQWSKAQYGEHNADFYTISCHETKDSPELEFKTVKTEGETQSATVSGLDPQTAYCFKVHAEFRNAVSLVSDISDPIQTYPVPVPPGKPIASNVTHNSIQLEWSEAHCEQHNIEFYTVCYLEQINQPAPELEHWKQTKTSNHHAAISNLAAQTVYSFKVLAEFSGGISVVSETSAPLPTHPAPVPPCKPIVSHVTYNSIHLEWSKPQYKEEKVDCYTVFCHEINDPPNPEQTWEEVKMDPIHKESVTVSSLAPHKWYNFKVCAKFESGMDLHSNSTDPVQTYPVPVPPGKPTASNVTHNSIQLEWSEAQCEGHNVEFYTVCYLEQINQPAPELEHWKQTKTSNHHAAISNLAAQTVYSFKVLVEFSGGISVVSETSAPLPTHPAPVPPCKPIVSHVTYNSVYLEWSKPQYKEEKVDCYTVFCHEINDPPTQEQTWEEVKMEPIHNESVTVSSLAPDKRYNFKVCAKFESGMDLLGEFSDLVQTYPVPVPPGKPTASNVTHNSVHLEWTEPQYGGQSVEFYTLLYCDVNDSLKLWKEKTLNSPSQSVTLDNLASQTVYSFKVQAQFKAGHICSDVSDPIKTDPHQIPPGKPIASNKTHNSVHLMWSKPQYKKEKVNCYTVFYHEIKDLPFQEHEVKMDPIHTQSVTVSSLSPLRKYSFKVCAKFESGMELDSNSSDPVQTYPKPVPPGKPTTSKVTHNSIQLKWTEPQCGGQSVEFYTVFYCDVNEQLREWKELRLDSPKQPVTVAKLASQTVYSFKVQAHFKADHICSDVSDLIKTDPDPIPPGKPIASSVTHNTVQLRWSKAQCAGQNAEFYTVSYLEMKETLDSKPKWKESKTNCATECAILPGLAAQTLYSVKVHAKFITGMSLDSEISDPVQTYPVPVPPGKPIASNVTHDSVQLEWTEPQYLGQSVESYTVLYRDSFDTAAEREWKKSHLDSPKQPGTIIENLASQSLYFFKVQAQFKTCIICGKSGKVIATHSPPVPPGIPTASNITDSSIQLKWTKAQYIRQNVKFYSILYREIKNPPGHWKEIKATEEVITIENLTPKTDYSFKVCATFESGVQTDSEISVTIQTASPPVPPGKPFASSCTHNSVQLEWEKQQHEKQSFNYYTVFYSKEPGSWMEVQVQHNILQPSVLVPDLTPETEYYFKVCAVFSSDSLESRISDSICTHPASVTPGKPFPYSVTHNSIELRWPRPDYGAEYVKSYTVLYKEMESLPTEWKERKSRSADESITIIGLSAEEEYCFKIRAELKPCDLASGTSETSGPIKTKTRIALQMLSKKPTKEGPLEFHNLLMVEQMSDERNRIRKCFIGKYCPCIPSLQKVLLVVGATGAGKSTLINGMINYILKVEWEDTFRFKLITEEQQTQSKSQTKWITAYTLPKMDGSPVPYTLTVIDTPGFGDTGGLIRDREITQQIKEFFSKSCDDDGIDHIDGIGFVTQSALARLTPSQKYIFDTILSIFGKDVADNIFMMVTFADGKTPPVMAAINDAGFPYHNSYKFNNSALFASNDVDEVDDEDPEADNFDKMFWKMGTVSFKKFFTDFYKAKPANLQLTREVLEERERLETNVSGLQPQIRRGLAKIEEMRQEEEVLKQREAEIAANQDFTYEVEIIKQRLVDLQGQGIYVTNCLKCNYTCHKECAYSKNEDKHKCSSMDAEGFCTVCPKRCKWDQHVNNPFRYEMYVKKEKRTLDDLKKKYLQAVAGKSEKESMMTSIDHQLQECHTQVLTMIKRVQRCIRRLDEIALKPNPLTEVDFLDLLIESEKQQAEPGWSHRVKYLESAKQQAVMLQRLQEKEVEAEMHTVHEQKSGEKPWYAHGVWYARFKYWAGLS